jgi:peptidoglycan lytic transglycosylase
MTDVTSNPWRLFWCTLALAVIALTALAAGAALAASGGSQQPRVSEAARVMAQIDWLSSQRAKTLAAERADRQRADAMRVAARDTQQESLAARDTLRVAKEQLAAVLVRAYKDGTDPSLYLMSARSLNDLIDRMDTVNRMANGQDSLISRIRALQKTLDTRHRAQLSAQRSAAEAANAALGAATRIDRILAERSAVLASLTAPVARSITTEQTRRKTLAHSDGGATSGNTFYGTATWYGWADWGNSTASGEKFNPNAMTCASPWLPFGTILKVTLLENGRSVVVRVNDRGPFGGGVIDLTVGAAKVIGMVSMGVGNVRVQVLS